VVRFLTLGFVFLEREALVLGEREPQTQCKALASGSLRDTQFL
jgi:hypothetical protein